MGSSMLAVTQAIPELEKRLGRPITVIGGLAVMCRLAGAYRVTSDLDTANRRSANERPQLDVLLATGAARADAAGAFVPTPAGLVRVDILEVSDYEVEHLPEDPNDRLHVLSHAWAVATASPVAIEVGHGVRSDGYRVTTRVAEPGPLVAMKLQSVMNRPVAKEGTDLLDIVRLVLDANTGPAVRAQFDAADPVLRQDAGLHAEKWFVEQRDKTLRKITAIPEGRGIDVDTLDFVAQLLPLP
ncbi:MAG: hypothetical protein JF587_07020 [Catenulisporales bacterium]|nr:hypothetical protein [Catenulisporales bacterium]